MEDEKFMTGAELCRYLHISTRKMKYFMDHDIIPHEDTGQATHRYRVKPSDADAFLHRMKHEVGFLSELDGMFSSHKELPAKAKHVHIAPPEDNTEEFKKFLAAKWKDIPPTMPVHTACEIAQISATYMSRLLGDGLLTGAKIKNVWHISKASLIDFTASPLRLRQKQSSGFKDIVRDFMEYQSRQKYNALRREKRKNERNG